MLPPFSCFSRLLRLLHFGLALGSSLGGFVVVDFFYVPEVDSCISFPQFCEAHFLKSREIWDGEQGGVMR